MYTHILVATDLSQESRYIAEKAKQLATLFTAKLSFVHVINPIPTYACGYVGVAEFMQQLHSEAEKEIQQLITELGYPNTDYHLQKGPVKSQILELAKTINADLILIGNHEWHYWSPIVGSTSNGVAHHSACDVMLVKSDACALK